MLEVVGKLIGWADGLRVAAMNGKVGYGSRIPVAVAPPMGWSVSGILGVGDSYDGPTNVLSVPPRPRRQVQLQCSFARQMQTHTIQFNGPDNDNLLIVGSGVRTQAEILWAVQGNVVRRVVDVLDGTAVSGEAEAVAVNIYDYSNVATNLTYQVAVTVTPGVRGNSQQAPTLRPLGTRASDGTVFTYGCNLVPANVVNYAVPPNVGAISALVQAINNAGAASLLDPELIVSCLAPSGSALARYGYNLTGTFQPLPANTATISVQNRHAADTVNVNCVLGIEG
jgi:hypothetical protein